MTIDTVALLRFTRKRLIMFDTSERSICKEFRALEKLDFARGLKVHSPLSLLEA